MAKANPRYGTGTFRRRIRLRAGDESVCVELEDGNHGFRLRLHHDGQAVTGIDVDAVRHPFNTCAEAVRPLRRIVGHVLGDSVKALRERLVPGDNCTHLYDMAALAVAHAGRSGTTLVYDLAVDDEGDTPARAEVHRNAVLMHAWTVQDHHIVTPAALAGRPMMRGFHAWASETFAGNALEAATALQRAYFVAQSRRHDFDPPEHNPGIADGMPQGSCYSYNHGVVEHAQRSAGTVRDFTRAADKLLRFEP